MSTQVTHFITVGDRTVSLTPEEAIIVAHGEIPRKMQGRLEDLGIKLPPRGTVRYFHEIRLSPDKVIRTEAHMRRLPDWERKSA